MVDLSTALVRKEHHAREKTIAAPAAANAITNDDKEETSVVDHVAHKVPPELLELIRFVHSGNDPQFVDPQSGRISPGCKHYASMCEQLASCCNVYVPCRLCHDEAIEFWSVSSPSDSHRMDRFSVKSLRCKACGHEQEISFGQKKKSCASCQVVFAKYACTKCMLFHNEDDRIIYHCDRCRICRLGNPEENYHCDTCDACVRLDDKSEGKSNHACLESSVKGNCPICIHSLFESVEAVVFLPCGHAMHKHCHEQLCKRDYRCCLCFRPFADMSAYFKQIDHIVAAELRMMPPQYIAKKVDVKCMDCGGVSQTQFHFQYLKCRSEKGGELSQECGSYNTHLL